jgi:lysophospholipase L1-like esterase
VSRDEYAENLRAMAHALHGRGGETILLTAPDFLELAPAGSLPEGLHGGPDGVRAIREVHAAYNDVVRRVAEEEGLCLVDAAKDFAGVAEPAKLFWRPPADFIHLSPEGYARLARAVAACAAFASSETR